MLTSRYATKRSIVRITSALRASKSDTAGSGGQERGRVSAWAACLGAQCVRAPWLLRPVAVVMNDVTMLVRRGMAKRQASSTLYAPAGSGTGYSRTMATLRYADDVPLPPAHKQRAVRGCGCETRGEAGVKGVRWGEGLRK